LGVAFHVACWQNIAYPVRPRVLLGQRAFPAAEDTAAHATSLGFGSGRWGHPGGGVAESVGVEAEPTRVKG